MAPRVLVSLVALTASWLAGNASAAPVVGWRMDGTGNYPSAKPPLEWSPTSHVLWSTAMPSWSNSSPILVGDKIFVASEPATLICLSAADGKILWQRTNPIEDAVSARLAPQPFLEQQVRMDRVQRTLPEKEYQLTALRQRPRKSPAEEKLGDEARTLAKQATELRQELGAIAVASRPPNVNDVNGYSSATPTSDGQSVYVFFGTGIAAAYDLEGQRRWIQFVDRSRVADGPASSPVLTGGKVLILVNDLIALDAATGDVAWRVNVPPRKGTPIAFRIDGEDLAILPSGHCVRAADGAIVASGVGDLEFASPLVQDGVIYMIQRNAQAFRIPEHLAEHLEFEPLWTALMMKGERYYSSAVLAGGLIYAATRSQILNVLDAKTGQEVYAERLRLGWTGGADSIFASLTQAGPYVYVSGVSGNTAVLQPGRSYQQLALNSLEPFRSSPVFDGDRMYVRGQSKFYCISSGSP